MCQSNYSWDNSGNACALQTSLDQSCQNNYGVGSYSHTSGGKATCGCSTGYVWSSDETTCVTPPATRNGYQVCSAMNATWDGSSHTSSGGFNCTCDSGYSASADGSSCIPDSNQAPVTQVPANNSKCVSYYGFGSYDTGTVGKNGGPVCGCSPGYGWNSNGDGCVDSSHFNTVCFDKYGYTAIPTGKTDAYGNVKCQCADGYYLSNGSCLKS